MSGLRIPRARLIPAAVCLVLGFLLVVQLRSVPVAHTSLSQSPNDQASYLSQLYRSNQSQQASLEAIQAEIAKYQEGTNSGSSNLVSLLNDVQQLRMVNGEVDVMGPGVAVRVEGGQDPVQMLQDLVNELRNAGAEAVAVNQIRLVTRSVIAQDGTLPLTVDGTPIHAPYMLEAIGDSATLATALERKGGLIALLEQTQGQSLSITVTQHAGADAIHLPKTALDLSWHYAHPAPDDDGSGG